MSIIDFENVSSWITPFSNDISCTKVESDALVSVTGDTWTEIWPGRSGWYWCDSYDEDWYYPSMSVAVNNTSNNAIWSGLNMCLLTGNYNDNDTFSFVGSGSLMYNFKSLFTSSAARFYVIGLDGSSNTTSWDVFKSQQQHLTVTGLSLDARTGPNAGAMTQGMTQNILSFYNNGSYGIISFCSMNPDGSSGHTIEWSKQYDAVSTSVSIKTSNRAMLELGPGDKFGLLWVEGHPASRSFEKTNSYYFPAYNVSTGVTGWFRGDSSNAYPSKADMDNGIIAPTWTMNLGPQKYRLDTQ